ncbi:MAG: hypothetical protein JWM99_120 [Verrucomicrobiales bacterium]|nr:hypothetical protein [Verrucomicrobiales bacterium]
MSVPGFELGFEFCDALLQWRDGDLHLGGGKTGRDVFRAVPIERKHFDEEQPFDDAACFRLGKLRDEFGVLPRVFNAGIAEDFQSLTARVVHEEERDAVVGGEVAGGEHLAVALVVGEGESGRTEDVQEAGRATTMLHVGPAMLADGRHVERVARLDKDAFLAGERVALRRIRDDCGASEIELLRRLNGGREHGLHESFGHNFE